MYRIKKGDQLLALVEEPIYVRKQGNGCFGLCDLAEAQGIALNGTVYHLEGAPALEDAEDVSTEYVDNGVLLFEKADKAEVDAITAAIEKGLSL